MQCSIDIVVERRVHGGMRIVIMKNLLLTVSSCDIGVCLHLGDDFRLDSRTIEGSLSGGEFDVCCRDVDREW